MLFRRRPLAPTELSDTELLKRYYATNEVADLGVLYDRHLTMVFAVCRRYLQPDEDAEDAVMQIFEELVVKLRHYEVLNFPAWLHSLARNHCLMTLRAQQRATVAGEPRIVYFSEADMESTAGRHLLEDDTTADSSYTEQQLQKLEQAMAELPLGQRRCLELFFLEKKCYRDIAQETGFDLQQVKSHLQNGKRNLKRYLESTTPSAILPHGRR